MADVLCPLLKKKCIEHQCAWFCHVTGTNPQTNAPMDIWDCAVKWTPVMMIENAKHIRGVQAATESMRNEVVERQDRLNNVFSAAAQAAALTAPLKKPILSNDGQTYIEG